MTASSQRQKTDGQLDIDLLVDAVCQQFERAWKAGERPRIEDYLGRVEPSVRPTALRELIAVEVELSSGAADISDYRQRFAEYPSAVDAGWALVRRSLAIPSEPLTDNFSGDTDPHLSPVQSAKPTAEAVPEKIGRYAIREVLGRGGFAVVYLAHDTQLDRAVALKVPRRERFGSQQELDRFVDEARHAAQLDHPAIVRVHDVQRAADSLYIVQQYVAGQDLARLSSNRRLTPQQVVRLITRVAEAIGYAHQRGLVHRDLKPANILVDAEGNPHVVDFGLAIHADEQHQRRGELAGTYPYMAPEQIRGEVHRLDGRSDIWSLGVIFYELLTGSRPFNASDRDALFDEIQHRDPRPPRQLNPAVPPELSRICLACLMKRARDRYASAADLVEDLRHWQAAPADKAAAKPTGIAPKDTSSPSPPKIIPKGLRSYDASDADFFLELLPGPRDRDGLPKSIRFWKNRIECTDPDESFSVGVIYGPSGCGKSSLVKAGLLPRLAPHVLPVYVEATAEDTEVRLLKGLRKHVSQLPADLSLPQALRWLRDRLPDQDRKILLVLDQFEQWLHAHGDDEAPQLIDALRHCDGVRVQCIVMVRDDFWLAVSRFMRDLEVPLVEGDNSALVDVFDIQHANKVLVALGRAFQCLPEGAAELTADQAEFVSRSLAGLAENGKVICVRLALFADMMKGKVWTPATLREVGGTEGVGVTFLEETFSAATAPPEHRYHQKAARAVLKALLPESGTDIKGHMRPQAELLEISGYANRPQDFADLLRILDSEIRLITPTDPEGKEGADESTSTAQSGQRYYQLTHDYLVPSLRDWLTRKQKETRKGRAELLLADRAAVWNARPENRQLPSIWQWLQIRWMTTSKNWTQPQRKMMGKATSYHALRSAGLALLLAVATLTGLAIRGRVVDHQNATYAAALVKRLLDAKTAQVPGVVAELSKYRQWADRLLHEENDKAAANSQQRLHASLALLPVDATHVDYLYGRLLAAEPHEVSVIRDALAPHKNALLDRLWAVVEAPDKGQESQRLQAAAALAKYDPTSEKWETAQEVVGNDLVGVPAVYLSLWMESLRPVRTRLFPQLSAVYRDAGRRDVERSLATDILADYAADQPQVLAELLMDADEKQFAVIFPKFEKQGEPGLPVLTGEIDQKLPADLPSSDKGREALAKRQANAAVALLRLSQPGKVWPLLRRTPPDDPRVRSYLIHRVSPLGAEAGIIIKRLDDEPDITARRAILLSLGEFSEQQLPLASRQALLPKLQEMYGADPDPGLHAAAEWLLRRWGQATWIKEVNEKWAGDKEEQVKRLEAIAQSVAKERNQAPPQWYVNGQGQTMVVIPGPVEFLMGSPTTEADRTDFELQHTRRIARTFALAATSVTKEQFLRFIPTFSHSEFKRYPAPSCPIGGVVWREAADYCNWLSKEEGIPEEQWCYENKGNENKLKASYLSLSGYRLPTEAEMEYATRAGALTSRYYGETEDLLSNYSWYFKNAQERTWPVGNLKPNDLGLFDAQGNVYTWCQESYTSYPTVKDDEVVEDNEDELVIVSTRSRVLRGGSFGNQASYVRSASRVNLVPSARYVTNGFRLARTLPLGSFTPLPLPAEGGSKTENEKP